MPSLLDRVERYYDEVPRLSATVEAVGPLSLFVRAGDGWPFYARPARDRSREPTAEDVRRVRERQRELGVPEALEWVAEVAPGLADAAAAAGLEVHRHPLMVLPEHLPAPPVPAGVRVLDADDPAVPLVQAAVEAAFGGADTPGDPTPVTHLRPRLLDGSFRLVGAFAEDGTPLGGGSHSPRGDVTELTGIGVLPGSRRRGVGAAVTAALVADALARGVRTVFLSAGGQDVERGYARLGFATVATACTAEPPA